jgi:hypothetical protein
MAINAYDANGYMLKVDLFASECSNYQNLQSLKEKLKTDPGFYGRCAAILGPHQPGITQPDPSYTGAQETADKQAAVKKKSLPAAKRRTPPAPKAPAAPNTPAVPKAPATPNVPDQVKGKTKKQIERARRRAERLKQQLEDTLGIHLPDLPATPVLPQTPAPVAGSTQDLLDFLLAP